MERVTVRKEDLIYPELSYKIIGALFSARNQLGVGHKESFYQKAVSRELKILGLNFEEQAPAIIKYKGEVIGKYFFDFLVEGKIVLEIKVRNYFSKNDIEQLYAYLKGRSLKLGIIGHFTKDGVKFKRVVNLKD